MRARSSVRPRSTHAKWPSPRAETNWYNILTEARRQGVLGQVAGEAQRRNSDVPDLVAACQAYLAWQSGGGFLTDREARLDRIGASFRLSPGDWSGPPVALTLRALSDGVRDKHKPFGGRELELARLENFVTEHSTGYWFVTGPAGFGKSALLANWVQARQDRGRAMVYHFFSRDRDHLATEADVLQNLCEQLAAYHGLCGTLPVQAAMLRALYPQLLTLPIDDTADGLVVVLDGLDQAIDWNPGPDLFPPTLPPGVRVVFSARKEANVDWPGRVGFAPDEIETLTLDALDDGELADLLHRAGGAAVHLADDPEFRRQLLKVSRGDPFYCFYLAQDVAARAIRLDNVDQIPDGVTGYFATWLDQLAADVDIDSEVIYDLLGVLSVARGQLLPADFPLITGSLKKGLLVKNALNSKLRRYLNGNDSEGYTIGQQRFADYLSKTQFSPDEVATYRASITAFCATWVQHKSRYALRHYAGHLTDAAAALPPQKRGEILVSLVDILTNTTPGGFRATYVEILGDLPALQADLERGVAAVAAYLQRDATQLLVRTGSALARFRESELRVEGLFMLAQQGRLNAVRERLRLFDLDTDWQQAILLLAAWVAVERDARAARDWRDQVLTGRPVAPPLQALWDWTAHALGESAAPQRPLPLAPDEATVEAILDRVAGRPSSNELLIYPSNLVGQLSEESSTLSGLSIAETGFLAEEDGPWLVAYAVTNAFAGQRYLDEYIDVFAQSRYSVYSQRALFYLLDAIVRHPREEWVLANAQKLAAAAVGARHEMRQPALEIALAAARARVATDTAVFDAALRATLHTATSLLDRGARESLDDYGEHKRRLAAFAEALACGFGARGTAQLEGVLDLALALPRGFAGYGAPAFLTLAESMHLCQSDGANKAKRATSAAQEAAHNVMDHVFCARTTARVNAIVEKWPPFAALTALADTISRFTHDPFTPEFAALHRVGEDYRGRSDGVMMLPLPDTLLHADTLRLIAEGHRRRLAELQWLNPEFASRPDLALESGTFVRLPDPGMPPLVAARLAAEVLLQAWPADQKRQQIQALVPQAASNPQALDTVLSRLILADPPRDAATWDTLQAA